MSSPQAHPFHSQVSASSTSARKSMSPAAGYKRAFDLALLLPTLPLFGAVTVVLGLVNFCTEGGPVFFTQERAGVGGVQFRIYKLRTMTLDDEVQARRPTRFGQWMRLRGLDELPQLFNVLKGDMSLVGPRPLLPSDVVRLSAIDPNFALRSQVPPGLTGLSQVCLATGATTTARLDAHYAQTCSVGGDLRILLRTAWMNVVGKKRGAAPMPSLKPIAQPATT